jgi:hypothetical protein
MEHSTCTLDISSDEESAARARDERGKENVPPPDDVSQTRTVVTATASSVDALEGHMAEVKPRTWKGRRKCEDEIELDRSPLGDLAAEDFYAEGCDKSSVFLVVDEEATEEEQPETSPEISPIEQELVEQAVEPEILPDVETAEVDIKGKGRELDLEVEALMTKDPDSIAPAAVLLQPIEKAEENFELWESGSAKDGE